MTTAGIMLAHQVAAKAFRDAHSSAWPANALPLMMVGTATATIALVPIFSRLLDRFSPLAVVAAGFALSAARPCRRMGALRWQPLIESRCTCISPLPALCFSPFWSLVSERFDPAGARAAYGRINAAGTMGALQEARRGANRCDSFPRFPFFCCSQSSCDCTGGVAMIPGAPALLPRRPNVDEEVSGVGEIFRSSYLRTVASIVVMASASSAILDFLLKSSARASFGAGPDLLRFFALLYGAVQVLSFLEQRRRDRRSSGWGSAER